MILLFFRKMAGISVPDQVRTLSQVGTKKIKRTLDHFGTFGAT